MPAREGSAKVPGRTHDGSVSTRAAGRSARLLPLQSAAFGLDELADVRHDRGGGTRLRDLELRVFVLERGVLGRTAVRRLANDQAHVHGERRAARVAHRLADDIGKGFERGHQSRSFVSEEQRERSGGRCVLVGGDVQNFCSCAGFTF